MPHCCPLLTAACHGQGWPEGAGLQQGASPSVQWSAAAWQVSRADWKFPLGSASVTLSLLF